jgi:hypothetical protein
MSYIYFVINCHLHFFKQGQRQKKLEDRRLRLEKEEEERKKIDIEEALIQAEKRKAAIEKAKVQQYYQTDRVKAFHVCKKIFAIVCS